MSNKCLVTSEDYWGKNEDMTAPILPNGLYKMWWVVKENDFGGLDDEAKSQHYRCALYYEIGKKDNHGFRPSALNGDSSGVEVELEYAAPGDVQYAVASPRAYATGQDPTMNAFNRDWGSYMNMLQAPPKAKTMSEIVSELTSVLKDPANMMNPSNYGKYGGLGQFTVKEIVMTDDVDKITEALESLQSMNAEEGTHAFAAENDDIMNVVTEPGTEDGVQGQNSAPDSGHGVTEAFGRSTAPVEGTLLHAEESLLDIEANEALADYEGPDSSVMDSAGGSGRGVTFNLGAEEDASELADAVVGEERAVGDANPETIPETAPEAAAIVDEEAGDVVGTMAIGAGDTHGGGESVGAVMDYDPTAADHGGPADDPSASQWMPRDEGVVTGEMFGAQEDDQYDFGDNASDEQYWPVGDGHVIGSITSTSQYDPFYRAEGEMDLPVVGQVHTKDLLIGGIIGAFILPMMANWFNKEQINMVGPVQRDNKTRAWTLFGSEGANGGPETDPTLDTYSGADAVEDDTAGEPEGTSEEVGTGSETETETETEADQETGTNGTDADGDAGTEPSTTTTSKKKGFSMPKMGIMGKQVGVGALLLGAGMAWWFIGRGRRSAAKAEEGHWNFDENVQDAPVNADNFETATHNPNDYAPHTPLTYDPEGKPFESEHHKGQGYDDEQDESLGERDGKKSQSFKDRRDEAGGEDKAMSKEHRKYDDVEAMDAKDAEFSESQREKLAKKGLALPDGSFPIRNKQDLKNAISTYGLAKNKGRAKSWIKKRAKQLNATDMLPAKWRKS